MKTQRNWAKVNCKISNLTSLDSKNALNTFKKKLQAVKSSSRSKLKTEGSSIPPQRNDKNKMGSNSISSFMSHHK